MTDFIYENNRGEKINLCQLPYILNIEPLFDYEWDYTKREKRRSQIIAGFTKGISVSNLVLHVVGDTQSIRDAAVDNFNSIVEADIYDGKAGKVWCGDWYTYGYIISSKNEKWQYEEPVVKKTISLAREQESWYREITRKSYEGEVYTPEAESWTKNFLPAYDFQHDYMTDFETSVILTNPDSLPSNFILSMKGPSEQPEIHIGDNVYQFNLDLEDGEVLTIDATKKTVTILRPDGISVNAFGARNSDYYIFERIPAGRNSVTWNGAFIWEIKLFEERSEPRWLTV